MMTLFVGVIVTFVFIWALFVDVGAAFAFESLLFGLHFRVDFIAKIFLIFSSFLWFVATFYSHISITNRRKRYWFWFALTFVGNILLIIADDALSFYLFFSLMSLCAFGLIIHSLTPAASKSAFVYIRYAILGEIALFVAILIASKHYGGFGFWLFDSKMPTLALWLFIFGFGIKGGIFLLHFWLPLAHANAPAAASALLSGVMLKAGILGLIRFLPFGESVELYAGVFLCSFGLIGIYFGLYGLFRTKIKETLAYSSISQMGYLFVLLGSALLEPRYWDEILLAIIFFSLHHAINKSALFFLAGEIMHSGLHKRHLILLLLFGSSLVGVLFSSGARAKEMMLSSLESFPLLLTLLAPTLFVTALLMLRFGYLSLRLPKSALKYSLALPILYSLALLSLLIPYITLG